MARVDGLLDRRSARSTVLGHVLHGPLTVLAIGLIVVATGCSSGSDRVVLVDGVAISGASFDDLFDTPDDLDEDQRVGGVVVLILQEAFASRARSELDLVAPVDAVDEAFLAQRSALEARGELSEMLVATNQTEARLRLNAELDVLRDLIGRELVETESGRFDLAAAQLAFRLATAEVCIRQIQLEDVEGLPDVLARLEAGDRFEDVAREVSIDPFVSRDEGVGAGGDLGCSAPSALPQGLDSASIEAPLDRATGPVASSVGVHVIEVYRRDEPDLERQHAEVIEAAVAAQGPELFRLWAVDVLRDIEVEVDDEFGRWGVLPETDPVPTVVPPYRYGDVIG